MKVQIIAVGKLKDKGLRAAFDDYAKRLKRYGTFAEVEVRDGSESEVLARLEKALPERGKVVALEVDGKLCSSHQLAEFVRSCEDGAVPCVSFLVGGAYGLPQSLSQRADLRLSMSKMIFPHRLARLMLVEQVYRAFTILRGEPYSH